MSDATCMKASRIKPPPLAGPREWVRNCMVAREMGPVEFLRKAGLSDNFLWYYNEHVHTRSLVLAIEQLERVRPLSPAERESLLTVLGVAT